LEKEWAKNCMKKIENYLFHQHNVEVEYGRGFSDCYFQGLSLIEINSCQNLTSRLHSLLHEAGHVLIRDTEIIGVPFHKSFPSMKLQGSFVRGNEKHRVDVLREEVLAWEQGRNLATCLDINIDEKIWARHRHDSLLSYARWV